jgi:hypothetical protein
VSARSVWLEQQRTAELAAEMEATRLGDRWRARQGHAGSHEHRIAVQMAWAEAVLAGKAVRS